MQFFKNFSTLYYDVNKDRELVIDILKRAMMRSNVVNNVEAYLEYTVKEGDSLQSISYKLYGSTYPFWVIMLINQELNPYYTLPLSEEVLKRQAIVKYGEDNLYEIHHYEDKEGNVVDSPAFKKPYEDVYYRVINGQEIIINNDLITDEQKKNIDAILPISNWQYEIKENEKKRNIKLLRPEYINYVINEFNAMVGQ